MTLTTAHGVQIITASLKGNLIHKQIPSILQLSLKRPKAVCAIYL